MKKFILPFYTLFICSFFCHAQGDAYLIGDSNDNEFFAVKAYHSFLYAVGRIKNSNDEYYGSFSRIDPNTGLVTWTTQLSIQSSLVDFIQDEQGGFIAVGRTEPIGTTGNPENNNSIIVQFDENGEMIKLFEFSIDGESGNENDDGRESLTKITLNSNPADQNFPYYTIGIVDRDDVNYATAYDDVILINFNIVKENDEEVVKIHFSKKLSTPTPSRFATTIPPTPSPPSSSKAGAGAA